MELSGHSYPPSIPKINSNQPARGQRRGFLCSDTHTHCTAAAGRIRLGSDTPSLPSRWSERSRRAGGTKLIVLRWGMRKRWYDLACSYCFPLRADGELASLMRIGETREGARTRAVWRWGACCATGRSSSAVVRWRVHTDDQLMTCQLELSIE